MMLRLLLLDGYLAPAIVHDLEVRLVLLLLLIGTIVGAGRGPAGDLPRRGTYLRTALISRGDDWRQHGDVDVVTTGRITDQNVYFL